MIEPPSSPESNPAPTLHRSGRSIDDRPLDKPLDKPLIPFWPASFHIPCLIRFLAGVEDFACRSAHYKLRSKMPSVANSVAKRSCLICLCDRKVVVDDTEWHLLFGCSATVENRSKYLASLSNDPLPAASLPTSPSISTLVNHFLFAREKSDNLGLFAQFVKDSLQARQRRLRRVQAQCQDSIFIEAANFPKEASDISLPVLQESQSLPEPQVPSCPACRGLHRAHTCGRARRVAQT